MTISATGSSNYISSDDLMEWLEMKTGDIYDNMRDAMDLSDTRNQLEKDLHRLSSDIQNLKAGGDMQTVKDDIDAIVRNYPDQTDIKGIIQPMSDDLGRRMAQASNDPTTSDPQAGSTFFDPADPAASAAAAAAAQTQAELATLGKPDATEVDDWAKQVDNGISDLSQQDQMGLINVQDLNSQVNQAKQLASNLIDALDRSESGVIQNIKA